MTIRDLYEFAKKHKCLDHELLIHDIDEGDILLAEPQTTDICTNVVDRPYGCDNIIILYGGN